jgi:methylglutaconyl-CoA hydratase
MDEAIEKYALELASYNPAAMQTLKQTLWEGTEHWDELLARRAAISGELVLSCKF